MSMNNNPAATLGPAPAPPRPNFPPPDDEVTSQLSVTYTTARPTAPITAADAEALIGTALSSSTSASTPASPSGSGSLSLSGSLSSAPSSPAVAPSSPSLSSLGTLLSAGISGLGSTPSRLSSRFATAVTRSRDSIADVREATYEKRHELVAKYSASASPAPPPGITVVISEPDGDVTVPREFKFKPTSPVSKVLKKWVSTTKRGSSSGASSLDLCLASPSTQGRPIWLKVDYPLFMYDLAGNGTVGPLEVRVRERGDVRYFSHIPMVIVADHCPGPVIHFLSRADLCCDIVRDLNTKLHLDKPVSTLGLCFLSSAGGSGAWLPLDRSLDDLQLPELSVLEVASRPVYQLEIIGASREYVLEIMGDLSIQAVTDLVASHVSVLGFQVQTESGAPPVFFLAHVGNPIRDPVKSFSSLQVKQSDILELRANLSDVPDPSPAPTARSSSQRELAAQAPKGSIILRIRIKSAPEVQNAAEPSPAALLAYADPLAGETVLHKVEAVTFLQVPGRRPTVLGDLFITNMHIAFGPYKKGFPKSYGALTKIPLFTVARIEKIGSSKAAGVVSRTTGYTPIDIFCKDFRQVRIGFDRSTTSRSQICTAMNESVFPASFLNTSAFDYKVPLAPGAFNGWDVYIPEHEQQRACIPESLWRTSSVNAGYDLCDSYPNKILVPEEIGDQALMDAAKFRSRGRIPILTYYHPNTATITRCSQPMPGLTGVASPADQALLEAIRKTNKTNHSVLYIYDCRPKANAMGNQAMGMGYEATGVGTGYANCKLEFLNIANIHVMRKSYNCLYSLVTDPSTEVRFWSLLEASCWLQHVSLLLSSSARIAHQIDRENISILIHCSDGWDRTAQISALAQIMLCDMYRTIDGFQLLIEKDWLSMGHKFHQRVGHGDKNFNDEQRAPIFPQFIDCVWQLMHQFPCSFEFNEKFLIKILDSLYSCHYGTFLCNSESARRFAELKRKTVSLWTDVARNRTEYVNLFYLPQPGLLFPHATPEKILIWTNYYFRWKYPPSQKIDLEMRADQMISSHEQEKQKSALLERTLADVQAQLDLLKSQLLSSSSSASSSNSSTHPSPPLEQHTSSENQSLESNP